MLHPIYRSALAALLFALVTLSSEFANAQAQRTFVKSTGLDGNPCTVASPCRGFAAALAATAANGEIIVLDSAGYGQVAISQSVSIIAPQGVYAGVSVFAGTNGGIGISINGSGLKVVLKGLSINGQGGVNGIRIDGTGNTLHVENCAVSNVSAEGIFVSLLNSEFYIKDSIFRTNGSNQVYITSSSTKGSIVNTRVEDGAAGGLVANGSAIVSVRQSVASGNSTEGFLAFTASTLTVEDSVASNNGVGIASGVSAKITAARNTVTGNTTGFSQSGTSTFETLGNNTVRNNTNNTLGTITNISGL